MGIFVKLKDLFKLKFNYLINKITVVILLVCIVIIFISFVSDIYAVDNMLAYKEINDMYFKNALLVSKTIILFLSVYLFAYSISFKNDFLIYLLIPLRVKRRTNVLITILINSLIILILFLITFFLFVILSFSLNHLYLDLGRINAFLNAYLVCIIYGVLSMLFMQITNNYFSLIISMGIFILTNSVISDFEASNFELLVLYVFPNISDSGVFVTSSIYLVIYLFILGIINILVYERRDLNF